MPVMQSLPDANQTKALSSSRFDGNELEPMKESIVSTESLEMTVGCSMIGSRIDNRYI